MWKRLHEELHSLYRSLNMVRVFKCERLRWAEGSDFKILTGKPTEKRPLGRPRHE